MPPSSSAGTRSKRLGLPMSSHPEVKSYWSVYVNSPKPEWNEKGRRHAQDTGDSTRSALGNDVAGQSSSSQSELFRIWPNTDEGIYFLSPSRSRVVVDILQQPVYIVRIR